VNVRSLVLVASTLAYVACSDDSSSDDDDGGRSKGGSSSSGTSGNGGMGGTNAPGGAAGSNALGGTAGTPNGGANTTSGTSGSGIGGSAGLAGNAGTSTGGATGRYTCSITENYCYCDTVFDNGPATACTGTWSCCMRGGDPDDPTDRFCECDNQTEAECTADIQRFGWTREATCP
jgi:hypothetical protein